jgi:hypothetical protein
MKLISIILIGFVLNVSVLQAQTKDCLKDFDFLIEKIKADYPGYNDKIKPENIDQLEALEKNLRNKISLYPDSCSTYLKQYVAYFKDNHLRVGKKSDKKINKEMTDVSSFGKNVFPNLDELKSKSASIESIEGIWSSWRGDIAIVKNNESSNYLGVAINYQGWKPNQILFEFDQQNDTVFNLKLHSIYNNYNPQNGKVSLHLKNRVLEIHNETFFVKKSETKLMDKTLLYTYIPKFPNGRNVFFVATCLSDSTYYIRIPGFLGFKDKIEKTIAKDWNAIISRPNMIIDIRNNGGGQDTEYQSLLKLMYTNPYEMKGVEWYASSGNIKLFEDALQKGEIRNGEEGIRWTQKLLSEMKKNIGGFVVYPSDKTSKISTTPKDSIFRYPKKIGIIINEGNASSAEQFLLSAKNSKKVILFGNNSTAGVLDYSNAVSTDFPSGNYSLTFPMTRSQRLPENPIDNIGIKPNVFIPFPATEQLFDKLDIWVYFVKNYLEFSASEK